MEKQKAIEKLQQQVEGIERLMRLGRFSSGYKRWYRNTEIAIEKIFGRDGRHLGDFKRINYHTRVVNASERIRQEAYENGLVNAAEILKSMIEEITEYWTGEEDSSSQTVSTSTTDNSESRKVFIVHGRDEAAKLAVARFIEKLDLIPIILHEQPNKGRTIIEKFEGHSDVGFAVILMTPDDVGALAKEKDKLNPRARQNVILELGFFLGKLGRKRVCALYKEGVEIPSDYKGVLFIPMDKNNGWQFSLAKEIKAAGIDVDMNKL